jgi:3-hydroxybutyryl-CoA dehydrogenase
VTRDDSMLDYSASTHVAVIGCGTLGSQIAFTLAARGGHAVRIFDVNPDAFSQAERQIHDWIKAIANQGGETIDESSVAKLMAPASSVADAVKNAELVIEAIPENLDMKRRLFSQMSAITENAILATNSSSLRSRYLADVTARPERVLNAHFYLEPWRRRAVELMSCGQTDEAVMLRTAEILRAAKLEPISLRHESTGLLFNRIWRSVKRECLRVIAEDIGKPEEIDKMWRMNFETAVGPCQIMDIIGLDVVLAIEQAYAAESKDPRDIPPAFLEEWVNSGRLGKKTGRGFYSY